MSDTELDPIEARQVLEEIVTRFGDRSKFLPPKKNIDFQTDLSPDQIKFLKDPNKRKSILGSRRCGKSFVAAYNLTKAAYDKPNTNCLFIGITRQSAKEIIWHYIEDLNNRYKLGAEPNLTTQTWVFANGSRIFVTGADTEREIRKYLGKGYEEIMVDECGEFGPHLETLIKKILLPTLIDTDGTLTMVGTPGPICAGYWYDITNGNLPSWSLYKWTLANNPNMPQWRGKANWTDRIEVVLKEVREENGYDELSPEYRRQYLGEWVEGGTSLIYSNFKVSVNTFNKLPDQEYLYLLGIDFGHTDPSAIVVGAYSPTDTTLYIVDSFKGAELPPEDFANIIFNYYQTYQPHMLLADGNGIGKAYIAQLQKQFNLPLQLAEKKDKLAFIELMNDDLRESETKQAKLKVLKTQFDLLKEFNTYQWADATLKILPTAADDHLLDALLYLWRYSLHFKGVKPKEKPKVGSPEYEDYLVEQELERINGQVKKSIWHRR